MFTRFMIVCAALIACASSVQARQTVTITTTGPASPVISFSPADSKGRIDTGRKGVHNFEDGTALTLMAPSEFNGAKLAGWTINAPGKQRSIVKKGKKIMLPLTEGEYTVSADYTTNGYVPAQGPNQAPVVYKKGGVPILGGFGRFMADLTHKPDGTKQNANTPVTANNGVSGFFTNIFGSNQQ